MRLITKVISIATTFCFCVGTIASPVQAQNIFVETGLKPVSTVSGSTLSAPLFQGIKIYPQEPFRFDFIMDTPSVSLRGAAGDEAISEIASQKTLAMTDEKEYLKLVKYFMASLTVPEGDLWVNLSPYEPDRIVPEALGQTEMGRDLLAQDYILKQLTASLMNPEGETGKKFWEKIYEHLYTTVETHRNPPAGRAGASLQNDGDKMQDAIESFNKVWIVPNKVEVYQNNDVAYITHADFKVMMEEDYVAQQKELSLRGGAEAIPDKINFNEIASQKALAMTQQTKDIIRQIVIPAIESEVNQGESFAPLRQIFHSMILAKWYEQHFKNSVLGQNYVDHNTTSGIELQDKSAKQKIYEQYVQAFKDGSSNLIKEEYDPVAQGIVTRKYFVGGFNGQFSQFKTSVNSTFSLAMLSEAYSSIAVSLDHVLSVDDLSAVIFIASIFLAMFPEYFDQAMLHKKFGFLTGALILAALLMACQKKSPKAERLEEIISEQRPYLFAKAKSAEYADSALFLLNNLPELSLSDSIFSSEDSLKIMTLYATVYVNAVIGHDIDWNLGSRRKFRNAWRYITFGDISRTIGNKYDDYDGHIEIEIETNWFQRFHHITHETGHYLTFYKSNSFLSMIDAKVEFMGDLVSLMVFSQLNDQRYFNNLFEFIKNDNVYETIQGRKKFKGHQLARQQLYEIMKFAKSLNHSIDYRVLLITAYEFYGDKNEYFGNFIQTFFTEYLYKVGIINKDLKEEIKRRPKKEYNTDIMTAPELENFFKINKAMLNDVDINPVGGIDLNNFNMQTSGQAAAINFDVDSRFRGNDKGSGNDKSFNQPIKMLVPQILHIGEVNLGVFLGLNTNPPDAGGSAEPSPELAAIKEET